MGHARGEGTLALRRTTIVHNHLIGMGLLFSEQERTSIRVDGWRVFVAVKGAYDPRRSLASWVEGFREEGRKPMVVDIPKQGGDPGHALLIARLDDLGPLWVAGIDHERSRRAE